MSEEDYTACRPKKRRSSSILRNQIPPNPAENNNMIMAGEQTRTLRRVSWAEKPTVKLFDAEADTCVKLCDLDAGESCAMSICSSVQAENNDIATDQTVRISTVMSLCTSSTVRSLNYEAAGTGVVDMVVDSAEPFEPDVPHNNCHVTEEMIEDDLTADMMSAFSKKFNQFTAVHPAAKTAESIVEAPIPHFSKSYESNSVKNGLNVVNFQTSVEIVAKSDEKVTEPIRIVPNTEIQEKDEIIITNETGQSSLLIIQALESQAEVIKVQPTRQQQRLAYIESIKANSDDIRAEIKQTIEKIEAAELKLSLINSHIKYGPNFGQVT